MKAPLIIHSETTSPTGPNIFTVKSSLDLHIDFGKDFNDPKCYNEDYSWDFISQLTNPPNPHKIFQLDYSGIIFFCEDPLVVTQVHPFYEDTAFTDSVMGVTGSYDISKCFKYQRR